MICEELSDANLQIQIGMAHNSRFTAVDRVFQPNEAKEILVRGENDYRDGMRGAGSGGTVHSGDRCQDARPVQLIFQGQKTAVRQHNSVYR